MQRCATERVYSVDARAVGKKERNYGCVAVHGGEVEGKTAGTVGFVGIEIVCEEDGEDGGVAPVRGDVQNGHGVIVLGDFGVDGVAAGWGGVVAAVAAVTAAIVAFAVWVVRGVCSGFWILLVCRWWDLMLRISGGREVSPRV